MKAAPWKSVLVVLAVLVLYYISRAPFLTQPLLGEEGMFADLLARSPAGPRYALMGRIGGLEVRDIYQHPGLMYAFYCKLGALMRALAGKAWQPTDIWVRLTHSLIQATLLSLLAWRATRARGWGAALALTLLAVALSSTLGLANSIHLQTDTSSGLLFAGLAALGLADAEQEAWLWPALGCLALSAVGKQEWAVGLGAGLLAAEIGGSLFWGRDALSLRVTGACLAAILLGQGISYAFDPENYLGGWHLLLGLSSHNAMAAGQSQAWNKLWIFRILFLSSLVLLLLCSLGLSLSAEPGRRRQELRASLVAAALFAPFALSTWNPSPRYFAPAWAAVLAALSVQVALRRWTWKGALPLLLLGLSLAYWQGALLSGFRAAHVSVTEAILVDVGLVLEGDAQTAAKARACAPRLSAGYAWNKSIDFIGEGLSWEDGEKMVKEHGGRSCPPLRPLR